MGSSDGDRGFVLFHRKLWDNPILKDQGKPFSKREAWIYLFSNLANGIERNGVPRGECIVSERFLAKHWLWDKAKVHRFIGLLENEGMIKKALCKPISMNRSANRLMNRFIICNYETYQEPRTAPRTAPRTKSKEGIKESININTTTIAKTIVTMPLKTGEEYPITEDQIELWKLTYPKVDVPKDSSG